MAYYDALIAIWPTVPGADQATKLVNLNAMTVHSAKPAIVNVTDVINAIMPADFTALTSLQLQDLTFLLQGGQTVNASPGTTVRAVFQTTFTGKTTTLTNLSALVAPFDNATVPWWKANGYLAPLEQLTFNSQD